MNKYMQTEVARTAAIKFYNQVQDLKIKTNYREQTEKEKQEEYKRIYQAALKKVQERRG